MKYTTDQLLSMAARGKTKRTRILLREASAKYLNAIKQPKREVNMKSVLDKRGSVSELPGYFQIFLLVAVFAGLTFIVLDKYLDTTETGSLATYTVTNESGYINATGYTLALAATAPNFQGPAIVAIINATDNTTIGAGNYTLTGNVITNATATNWPTAKITYTYESTGTGVNAYNAINQSTTDLFDYGVGFLGIIILVSMVYLIIRIVSGSSNRK